MSKLVQLIYASRATFAPNLASGGIEKEVGRVLVQSRRNNPKKEIGGVLYYGDGCFFQCLEGAGLTYRQLQAEGVLSNEISQEILVWSDHFLRILFCHSYYLLNLHSAYAVFFFSVYRYSTVFLFFDPYVFLQHRCQMLRPDPYVFLQHRCQMLRPDPYVFKC